MGLPGLPRAPGGRSPGPLPERCQQRSLNPGALLCKEGQVGTSLYFLLRGAVEVFRRDPQGFDRELGVIHSPAVIGHMSLVDRSKRSATCRVSRSALVAELDYGTYQQIYSSPDAQGRSLRRLLMASMADQLASGNERMRALIAPLPDAGDGEPPTEEALAAASSAYEGWGR